MAQIAGLMPCIVTGDFNTGPGSIPYVALLAEHTTKASSLHDVFRIAHPVAMHQEGTIHFFTGWRGGPRMDWILASSHFQIIEADIDRTRGLHGYSSDHFPVHATLRMR
jgi:endonuclease/exonuclease/phosphatase family metal-dependent hydrolase